MKLHANARTCPHSRALAMRRIERKGWTLSEAAEAAGISVRHDPNLRVRAGAGLHQQAPPRVGHDDHTLGLVAQLGENLQLMRRRLRQDGVQGHDERLRQLLRKGKHVLAVAPTEDPVLVLEENDVDVEPTEQPRSTDVVPTNSLGDGGEKLLALGARRLLDDDNGADFLDPAHAEERGPQVEREGDSADTRRVRREDRGTHDSRAPLSDRCPTRRRPRAPARPGWPILADEHSFPPDGGRCAAQKSATSAPRLTMGGSPSYSR
jgi:hypothetical protein